MLLNIISKHKLMKKQILILSVFAALLFISGCSPRILVREVVRDSLIVRTTLDSVYLYEKDSIFVKQKGDTVWLERLICMVILFIFFILLINVATFKNALFYVHFNVKP